jgi:hypothetical protein
MRLFVSFAEDDFLTKRLEGTTYKKDDLNKRFFVTKNKVFSFRSNYAIARGLNVLKRFMLNMAFLYLTKKTGRSGWERTSFDIDLQNNWEICD